MKKRILLIGYNYFPEPTGIGKYSGEMISWLAERGYHCTVITSYPYYPYWKVQEPYTKNRFGFKTEIKRFPSGGCIKVKRCPMYVPETPSGFKRVLLDLSFTITAGFQLIRELFRKKHDVVMTVAPSFQFGLLGLFYKKLRRSKLVYHIHDMQIEAARDLRMITNSNLLKLLFKIEKFIFAHSDVLSTVSEQMVRKIEAKAHKQVRLFPNWTNVESFFPVENNARLKESFGFKPSEKIVLYSGGIGEKQGLEAIIYAAEKFKERTDFKFVICGSGPYKEKLQQLTDDLNLDNVCFLPLQPKKSFNQFLNMADVHLVVQKANASGLMMPSKLTTILSVGGLALVTAKQGSGLETLLNKYNMGISVEAEDQEALDKGICQALSYNHEDKRLNARAYAEKYLCIHSILNTFEEEVLDADQEEFVLQLAAE